MSGRSVFHPPKPSKPTVVPPPAEQTITQLELAALLSLRGRLNQLQEQIVEAERSIEARLEAGVVPELGDHIVELIKGEPAVPARGTTWEQRLLPVTPAIPSLF